MTSLPELDIAANKILAKLITEPSVKVLIIGGSVARGHADKWSDLDLCLVFETETDMSNFVDIWTNSTASRYWLGYSWRTSMEGWRHLDIRCTTKQTVSEALERVTKHHDPAPKLLDTLSLFVYGIYKKDDFTFTEKLKNIRLTKELTNSIITHNLRFVRDYGFDMFIEHKDHPQYFEMLNVVYRAYVHIASALMGDLFLGYRSKLRRRNTDLVNLSRIEFLLECAYTEPSAETVCTLLNEIRLLCANYSDSLS